MLTLNEVILNVMPVKCWHESKKDFEFEKIQLGEHCVKIILEK